MSKNNMKLIMEGWRHSLKEMNAVESAGMQGHAAPQKKEEINEEELDEGIKEIALSAILGMAGLAIPSDADAGTMSTYNQSYSQEVVQGAATAATNAAAKNPEYSRMADILNKAAAKPPTEDTYVDGAVEIGPDGDRDADLIKYLLDKVESSRSADSEPEASSKPDVSGMGAPEARKALYDYYNNLPDESKPTNITFMVNKDLRDAGVGQMSDAERGQAQQDQASMADQLKSLREEG